MVSGKGLTLIFGRQLGEARLGRFIVAYFLVRKSLAEVTRSLLGQEELVMSGQLVEQSP